MEAKIDFDVSKRMQYEYDVIERVVKFLNREVKIDQIANNYIRDIRNRSDAYKYANLLGFTSKRCQIIHNYFVI